MTAMSLRPVLWFLAALALFATERVCAEENAVARQSGQTCDDAAACQAQFSALAGRLKSSMKAMKSKDLTLRTIEGLRNGVLGGERVELPSVQKRHLERGNPVASLPVILDAKHAPVTVNNSKHVVHARTVLEGEEVRHHAFLPLKRSSNQNKEKGPLALLVAVGPAAPDSAACISIATVDGEILLSSFDLGHGDGVQVTQLAMSPNQEQHFVATGDETGAVRVHNIKVIAKREVLDDDDDDYDGGEQTSLDGDGEAQNESSTSSDSEPGGGNLDSYRAPKENSTDDAGDTTAERRPPRVIKQLFASLNFSSTFGPAKLKNGDGRDLTALLAVERGSQMYFVTGDALGGIAVFNRNGTLKGRAVVTDDPGGVTGLLRAQGQSVLFWSSHSFGTFSISQIDVQLPPCTGWDVPLYDVALDPHYSNSRVILSLANGDVLVYSTTRGKSKACDLTLKFPRLSDAPFLLQAHKGHVMALPVPPPEQARRDELLRELFFFNPAVMEVGYGAAPTNAMAMQVSFGRMRPEGMSLFQVPSTPGERSRGILALRMAGSEGLEIYELFLRQPPAPKSEDDMNWLDWFPKVGVFGVVLVGVVIWNVRKESSGMEGFGGEGMDENEMKEIVNKAMASAGAE